MEIEEDRIEHCSFLNLDVSYTESQTLSKGFFSLSVNNMLTLEYLGIYRTVAKIVQSIHLCPSFISPTAIIFQDHNALAKTKKPTLVHDY